MPFEPIDPLGGFTAGPALPEPAEAEGDSTLATIGKIAAPVGVAAGLVFAPEVTIPALGAAALGSWYADPDAMGAAFRTENTVGSALSSNEMGVNDRRVDPHFDPWAEIEGTPYEPYYEQLGGAANRSIFDARKADIDRENKDRTTLAQSGVTGMVSGMAAGMFDLPSLIPGAVLMRSPKRQA